MSSVAPMRQVGLVVHPVREMSRALEDIRIWARTHDVNVVQLRIPGQTRVVAPAGQAIDCDVIVAVGGDGTVLAAIRAGAAVGRPVLGVACGSLGALALVSFDDVIPSLERFRSGDWTPGLLPALRVAPPEGTTVLSFNDLVVVRASPGQVGVTIHIDGVLYSAYAGDGVVVSTQVGSSAYALAAGGPLVMAGAQSYLLTPLAAHGGRVPPLVLGARSSVRLQVDAGHVGARVELDGQAMPSDVAQPEGVRLEVGLIDDQATLVGFGDEEPYLAGLRRRRIVIDSPRMYVREARIRAAGSPQG